MGGIRKEKEEREIDESMNYLDGMGYSIHYHVWDFESLVEIITYTIANMQKRVGNLKRQRT